MGNEIEKLPRLIQKAIDVLTKATSAAEILEASQMADVAYTAAKKAAHFAKKKTAHDEVITACRQTMADALVIETQAQCRLADEYDAAQERGEVNKAGQPKKSIVPNENNTSVADIGLTRKQVHEARKIRDAEKENPGAIRKAMEDKLEAGEEPTRADVRRAVNGVVQKGNNKRSQRSPKAIEREEKVAALKDAGLSTSEIAVEIGLGERAVNQALEHVIIKREAGADPLIDPSTLPMTAQQKLEAWKRQEKARLAATFHQMVDARVEKRIDEIILPDWRNKIEEAKRIYDRRKGIMDKATFNKIRRGLHPDSRNSISDKLLAEAFDAFMALEKFLLNEKDSPTEFGALPSSLAEWDKMRVKRPTARKKGPSDIERAAQ